MSKNDKFTYTKKGQVKFTHANKPTTRSKTNKFTYTKPNQIHFTKSSAPKKPKSLTEMATLALFEQEIDKLSVINPETKKRIKVKSALTYDKQHPAYKAAIALIKKRKITVPKEMPATGTSGEQGELFYSEPWETGDTVSHQFKTALRDDEADEHLLTEQDNLHKIIKKDFDMSEAFSDYTSTGYILINTSLRGGDDDEVMNDEIEKMTRSFMERDNVEYNDLTSGEVDSYYDSARNEIADHIDEKIKYLDKAFSYDECKLKNDVVCFRGISRGLEFDDSNIGDEFVDDGFISTSLDENIADRFAMKNLTLEILVPRGSRAIYCKKLSSFSSSQDDDSEQELLLRRGSKFKIISKDIKSNRIKVIKIPNDETTEK